MSFIGKKRKLITLLVVAAITACFLTTAAYADTSETNITKNIIIGGDISSFRIDGEMKALLPKGK